MHTNKSIQQHLTVVHKTTLSSYYATYVMKNKGRNESPTKTQPQDPSSEESAKDKLIEAQASRILGGSKKRGHKRGHEGYDLKDLRVVLKRPKLYDFRSEPHECTLNLSVRGRKRKISETLQVLDSGKDFCGFRPLASVFLVSQEKDETSRAWKDVWIAKPRESVEVSADVKDPAILFKDLNGTKDSGFGSPGSSMAGSPLHQSPSGQETLNVTEVVTKKALTFRCSKCDKSFTTYGQLKDHLMEHLKKSKTTPSDVPDIKPVKESLSKTNITNNSSPVETTNNIEMEAKNENSEEGMEVEDLEVDLFKSEEGEDCSEGYNDDDPETGAEENYFGENMSPEEEETPEDLDASVVELEKTVDRNESPADDIEEDLDASIVEVGQEEEEEEAKETVQEEEEGSDWTDRCAYECRLCQPTPSRVEGKSSFTSHILSAHNYTFERYVQLQIQ